MTLCWSQVKARGEELMAISETIKILNNARKPCDRGGVFSKIGGLCSPKDDALESFKKALPEKTSFLQVGQAQSQPVGEWITWSVETVRWTPRWASRPTNCCNCWIFQEQRHGLLDRKLDENNAKAWWFFKEWKLVFPTTTTWKDGRNTHSKVVYENNYYWRAAYEISPRHISDIQERVRRSLRKAVAFWQSCISSFGPARFPWKNKNLYEFVDFPGKLATNKLLYSGSSSNFSVFFFEFKFQEFQLHHEHRWEINRYESM